MNERPILFSAPMVRAILAGTKTQTRRVVKDKPFKDWDSSPQRGYDVMCENGAAMFLVDGDHGYAGPVHCPYGQSGDRLWVRETWMLHESNPNGLVVSKYAVCVGEKYWRVPTNDQLKAMGYPKASLRKRPSIHMPRWASRITLEITGVRVERLQDISEQDAIAEGVEGEDITINGVFQGRNWRDYQSRIEDPCEWYSKATYSFKSLWESINGTGSLALNPWVWVVEFRRIKS